MNLWQNVYFRLEVIQESMILAVNQEYIETKEEQIDLCAGDEIALIPPISGG